METAPDVPADQFLAGAVKSLAVPGGTTRCRRQERADILGI